MRESVELREKFLYRLVSRPRANEVHGLRDMFLSVLNRRNVVRADDLRYRQFFKDLIAIAPSPDAASFDEPWLAIRFEMHHALDGNRPAS